MKFLYATLAASLLALSFTACDDDDDDNDSDGAVNTDATADASTSDASTTDASTADGSTTDAGNADGSTTDADGSTTDASTSDGSTTDTDGSTTDTDGSTTDTDGSTTDTDGSTTDTDGGTNDAPANDLCKDAAEVALGQTVTGTTVKAHGELYEDEPDVFYKLNVAAEGYYELTLTPAVNGFAPELVLWKDCSAFLTKESVHPSYIDHDYNDNADGSPAKLLKKLAAGSYIASVTLRDHRDYDDKALKAAAEGSTFTLAFTQYTPTTPSITSVTASIQEPEDSEGHRALALRINGKDEGKDVEEVAFELLGVNNEVLNTDREEGELDSLPLYPKYGDNGVFEDAFASYFEDRALTGLDSAVSIKVWLIDAAGVEGEAQTVGFSSFSVVERNEGQTCDRHELATDCADGLACLSDANGADVCQE